jgi:hypothetical protein
MTTTKVVYIAAMILPGGFALLAGLFVARAIIRRHRAAKALASQAGGLWPHGSADWQPRPRG